MADKRPPGFMLYDEQLTAFVAMADYDLCKIIRAAAWYFLDGTEPETMTDVQRLHFEILRKKIDAGRDHYKDIQAKRTKAIQSRWARKQAESGSNTNVIHRDTNPNPNPNPIDKANALSEKKQSKEKPEPTPMPKPARFKPPTIEDARGYFDSLGAIEDAEPFMDYYTANGWRVGKNPMKDWKAAARNWTNRRKEHAFGFDGNRAKDGGLPF